MNMLSEEITSDEAGFAPSAQALAEAVAQTPHARFVLRLYVSGMTARSAGRREHPPVVRGTPGRGLRPEHHRHLPAAGPGQGGAGHCRPTLVKTLPPPLRRVIGDMGDSGRIMVVLGIVPPAGKG